MKTSKQIIDEVISNIRENGHLDYGESVTILEHGVQSAVFAERDGADDLMIAAAFLHDYGHFVHDFDEDIAEQGIDAVHEEVGAAFLRDYFIPEVVEPGRLHVAAKRYLVATDPAYRATLSPASIQSLELQGGPFDAAGVKAFEAHPHFARAVQLRHYDDLGKVPGMEIPDLEYYRPFLEKSLIATNRTLDWPACHNVRDLGGLRTHAGRETVWGAIVRSDIQTRLTSEGKQALLDYGIRTIIDLRGPQEVVEESSPFADADPAILTYQNLPLEGDEPAVSDLIRNAKDRAEVYCIVLDHYPKQMASALGAIANARTGGVLIHCHGGKDRTGTVSALLLRLAGVPDVQIAADYAQSQEQLWPLWEEIVEEAGGEENADFWLKPTATADTMQKTLAHMDEKYGGVEEYMEFVGLENVIVERLRARLTSG